MVPSRPRLIAGLLCLVLLLGAAFLLATGRFAPRFMHRSSGAAELVQTYDVQAEPAPPPDVRLPAVESDGAEPPQAAPPAGIAVALPRIAYTYGYSFSLDRERIAALQESHLALCRGLGPASCRVTAMRRGENAGGDAGASLKLQVAAAFAERFGRGLVEAAGAQGGETVDRSIAAEDLSRQMIDSEARIRTREVLIQRLTVLLQTRSGNIAQAVEAERAINTAQEELEAARAALAEMRGRVAMSAVEIAYLARGAAPDAANPIGQAFESVASAAASSVAAMIMIVGVALPWALLAGLIFLAARAIRRRGEAGAEADSEARQAP